MKNNPLNIEAEALKNYCSLPSTACLFVIEIVPDRSPRLVFESSIATSYAEWYDLEVMLRIPYKLFPTIFFVLLLAGGLYFFQGKTKSVSDIDCKECNLIMISLSNVSADHMSLYGYERITTPNLDKWSKDAVVFDNAFTQSSWTLPVGVSLFTSLYPYTHQVMDRDVNNKLDENIKTLPEILKDKGYKTAAFTGGLDYSNNFGHMRGFDKFEEEDSTLLAFINTNFEASLKKASGWIKDNSKEKFFLFTHGYDAHCPFDPPVEFKEKFSSIKDKNIVVDNKFCVRGFENSDKKADEGGYKAYYYKDGQQELFLNSDDIEYLKDSYDEEILSVDEKVSDFLKGIDKKVLDKTIVIIFSDHGEMFAKHGRFGRAGIIRGTFYDDVVHIPLIFKMPGIKGKTVDGLVQTIDVMPTLLDVLGITVNQRMQGEKMGSLIKDNIPINKYVFGGLGFNISSRLDMYKTESISEYIRSDKWKLIREVKFSDSSKVDQETFELYDILGDKNEQQNLIDEEKEVAKELKEELLKWAEEAKSFIKVKTETNETSDDFKEESRKRGYW